MRFSEIQTEEQAIDNLSDLYKQKADALKDKAEKAGEIAKQKRQHELVDKARDNLRKQQEKLMKSKGT
jgi:hypothetical protein